MREIKTTDQLIKEADKACREDTEFNLTLWSEVLDRLAALKATLTEISWQREGFR